MVLKSYGTFLHEILLRRCSPLDWGRLCGAFGLSPELDHMPFHLPALLPLRCDAIHPPVLSIMHTSLRKLPLPVDILFFGDPPLLLTHKSCLLQLLPPQIGENSSLVVGGKLLLCFIISQMYDFSFPVGLTQAFKSQKMRMDFLTLCFLLFLREQCLRLIPENKCPS